MADARIQRRETFLNQLPRVGKFQNGWMLDWLKLFSSVSAEFGREE